MIITQTPFRMSFFGGGTDMKNFFKEHGGAVLSTTFDKIIYRRIKDMKVVIMAGGKGTRISSVASDIPKPMIKIEDIPVLEREIECLKNQGFDDIIITVSHLGNIIMSYFIDAAEIVTRSHPEVRFVVVGDGELKNQLHEYVKSKKLQDVFLFLGYRNDIQNVISQLDFIVLSSLWEGLPLTPIEAYSVGKTVIGTAVDGLPHMLTF